jgi:hypothetical protein
MTLSLSSSNTTTRSFTPHHTLWRSLLTVFISMLSHVRLPLAVGDEICDFLGTWIAKFAGAKYYMTSRAADRSDTSDEDILPRDERAIVENVIRAMEAWNKDLTWFLFRRELAGSTGTTVSRLDKALDRFNARGNGDKRRRYAELVF